MIVSQIYHSREDRIKDIHTDADRVQYDGKDEDRIQQLVDVLTEYNENLENELLNYLEEMNADADEDSVQRMRYARQMVVEKWALAQAALSKAAWVLRIDGNVAYERCINALKSDDAMDMRGL